MTSLKELLSFGKYTNPDQPTIRYKPVTAVDEEETFAMSYNHDEDEDNVKYEKFITEQQIKSISPPIVKEEFERPDQGLSKASEILINSLKEKFENHGVMEKFDPDENATKDEQIAAYVDKQWYKEHGINCKKLRKKYNIKITDLNPNDEYSMYDLVNVLNLTLMHSSNYELIYLGKSNRVDEYLKYKLDQSRKEIKGLQNFNNQKKLNDEILKSKHIGRKFEKGKIDFSEELEKNELEKASLEIAQTRAQKNIDAYQSIFDRLGI